METNVQKLINEIQRRINTIKSEPNGVVRETMIDNLLCDTMKYLEDEKTQCTSFSKFIRLRCGEDYFSKGYSTEMIYDGWIKKYNYL